MSDMALVPSSAPAAASLLSTGGDAPVKAAPVATQTSAIGIINPPPDIRSIVVRTLLSMRATRERC